MINLLCRINTKTGKVTRDALYEGQNLDHPRVNPNFYSRPTRYVYFNAAKPMHHQGNSGPPQVSCLFNSLKMRRFLANEGVQPQNRQSLWAS